MSLAGLARKKTPKADRAPAQEASSRLYAALLLISPPVSQRLQDRSETSASFRELVLKSWRMFAVKPSFDQIVRFHILKPGRQRVRCHTDQRLLKILESARPMQKQIPQQQNSPPLADYIHRSRDRAIL